MLTRAAVAKRLGRSIATVRRLEGNELHPWTDERGVHRFDAAEVDELARRAQESGLTPFGIVAGGEGAEAALADAADQIGTLKEQLAAMEKAKESAASRSRLLVDEARQLRETAIEALELVEAMLERDTPYGVRVRLRQLRQTA